MAILRIPEENRIVRKEDAIREYLATCGIEYERCMPSAPLASNASPDQVLCAYSDKIEHLSARGGYVTADVIDVNQGTPGLDAMLAKFNREHWHNEDEVRFIVQGHGVFHIHPKEMPIVAIEVEAGDLITVPRGTWHWFDLCSDRRIRAIRLFQEMAGWIPYYTDSAAEAKFQPICFGVSYLPSNRAVTAS